MKKLLWLCLFLSWTFIKAQQVQFDKVFYDSTMRGMGVCALEQKEGSNHFVGIGYAEDQKGFFYEIDSVGNMAWNRTYGYCTSGFPGVTFYAITKTLDSAYVVVGDINDTASSLISALIVKLNNNGDTLWCKMIQSAGCSIHALNVLQTNDSGFVMCGYADSSGNPGIQSIFVAHISKNGNLLWSRRMYSGNLNECAYSVRQTSDSGYIVSGITSQGGGGCLIKMNKYGGITWAKGYTDGNVSYYLTDATELYHSYYAIALSLNAYEFLVVDQNGIPQSTQAYAGIIGGASGFTNLPQARFRKINNNAYVSIIGSCSGSNFFLSDTLGNVQWNAWAKINASDILGTKDGGYLIAGNGPMCAAKAGSAYWNHMGLIKTDTIGSDGWYCSSPTGAWQISAPINFGGVVYTISTAAICKNVVLKLSTMMPIAQNDCVTQPNSVSEQKDIGFTMRPQPASEEITIESREPCAVEIYSLVGSLMKRTVSVAQTFTVSVSDLSYGTYFVVATSTKGQITRKLIIVR